MMRVSNHLQRRIDHQRHLRQYRKYRNLSKPISWLNGLNTKLSFSPTRLPTVYIVDTKYPNTKPFVNERYSALKSKYPNTRWVLKEKLVGYMDDDPELWKEIKAKGAGAIVLVGHRSSCSPAVVGHAVTLERIGVPAVPMITQWFQELVTTISFKKKESPICG
jgi:hypothetical protein